MFLLSPPSNIFRMSYGLKVIGVHACTVMAKVINLKSIRYLALMNLVIHAMCAYGLPAARGIPVSLGILPSLPLPAPRSVVHDIRGRELSFFVPLDKSNGRTLDVPLYGIGLLGDRRLIPTSTLTETGWIRAISVMLHAPPIARLTYPCVNMNLDAAVRTVIFSVIFAVRRPLLAISEAHPAHPLGIMAHWATALGASLCELVDSWHVSSLSCTGSSIASEV